MDGTNIFVGTLTRYYSAAWDTGATRLAKSKNEPHHLFAPRPGTPELNPEVIEPIIHRWRAGFATEVAAHLPVPLFWPEGMGHNWYAVWLGNRGYSGLVLAAAYAQNPTMTHPIACEDNCLNDPAVADCISRRPETPIFNIVASQLWLPGNFSFGTQYPEPVGNPVQIASLGALKKALDKVNEIVFHAYDADIAQWSAADPMADTSFEAQIRFGFATAFRTCQLAVKHNLPMKMHY